MAAYGVKTRYLRKPAYAPMKTQKKSANIWDRLWEYRIKVPPKPGEPSYLERTKRSFFDFEYAPIREVDRLIEKNPHVVNLNERQNKSPTMRKILEIARQYNGTLNGYAIPPESGRTDSRVTFTGFELPIDKETAKMLRQKFRPDEFDEIKPGLWRFWWD